MAIGNRFSSFKISKTICLTNFFQVNSEYQSSAAGRHHPLSSTRSRLPSPTSNAPKVKKHLQVLPSLFPNQGRPFGPLSRSQSHPMFVEILLFLEIQTEMWSRLWNRVRYYVSYYWASVHKYLKLWRSEIIIVLTYIKLRVVKIF